MPSRDKIVRPDLKVALGRRLPLAIPTSECLLVAAAHSKAVTPVSANPSHRQNVRFSRRRRGSRPAARLKLSGAGGVRKSWMNEPAASRRSMGNLLLG